ncbi:MAG: DUF2029 domain-containing protein [Flavobacteriaceae bacterium]|nr:DUF2029 domain-containing protein [Flavobacteriaceae bacterium]
MLNFLKSYWLALLIGLVCLFFYGYFAYDLERSEFIKFITLVGSMFILTWWLKKSFGWNFWLLAAFGVVFRFIFLPAIPNLSQDFYRFLWDGRLLLQGINPYLITPETYIEQGNFVLTQANELYRGMGELNGSHYSNYPPVNQLLFGIAALFGGKSIVGSVVVLRLIIILADIGILYFGKKLLEALQIPVKNIFWYYLNPFIIIELTGNLHFEGVMLFFFVWALYLLQKRHWIWVAVLIGLSISVKLIPLIFLPLFYKYFVNKGLFSKGFWKLKKFFWLIIGTVVITFLPFLSSNFIANFSQTIALWFNDFEFNASVHYIIRWISFKTIGWNIIYITGKILPLIVMLMVLILAFFRRNRKTHELITAMLFSIVFYFLLSTTVHPWYIATPLILCLFTRYRFPVLWSFLVMFTYSAYGPNGFEENLWLVAAEYVLVIGYMLWEIFTRPKNYNILNSEIS